MKLLLFFLFVNYALFSQNEGVKAPVYNDYKNDSSYTNFGKLHDDVAKAQIVALKNGALLVRLKTNSNTINQLKKAGNTDLATQVERETYLKNKIIMFSYLQEFNFCPVYFFYSDCSDSVKHKRLENIFLDTTLTINPSIVCAADFYLIADNKTVIYNSSLGLVPESLANKASENGTSSREVAIGLKNRFFIQPHKPFPFFQIKTTTLSNASEKNNAFKNRLFNLYEQLSKSKVSTIELKDYKKFRGSVYLFNLHLQEFYNLNKGFNAPSAIKEYVY